MQLGVEQTLGAEKGESEGDKKNVPFSVLEHEGIFPAKTREILISKNLKRVMVRDGISGE